MKVIRASTAGPCRPRRSMAGSAYLVTLLVLLVVTLLALGVAATTQTELWIGTNERINQRAFFAAESALSLATARIMVDGNKNRETIRFSDVPAASIGVPTEASLLVAGVMPVATPPCAFCQINSATENEGASFYQVTHWVKVEGSIQRVGDDTLRAAHRKVSSMIELQPWRDINPPAYERQDHIETFAEIVATEN